MLRLAAPTNTARASVASTSRDAVFRPWIRTRNVSVGCRIDVSSEHGQQVSNTMRLLRSEPVYFWESTGSCSCRTSCCDCSCLMRGYPFVASAGPEQVTRVAEACGELIGCLCPAGLFRPCFSHKHATTSNRKALMAEISNAFVAGTAILYHESLDRFTSKLFRCTDLGQSQSSLSLRSIDGQADAIGRRCCPQALQFSPG